MGGLGEAAVASVDTGIAEHSTFNVQRSTYYNLHGQPIKDSYKGLVIVQGKKMIRK